MVLLDFEKVVHYLFACLQKENKQPVELNGFEIHLTSAQKISFKKDGYTLGTINKNGQAESLAKNNSDNEAIVTAITTTYNILLKLAAGKE